MTTSELLQQARQRLSQAGVDSPAAEAVQLLEAASGLSRSEQLLQRGPLPEAVTQRFSELLERRLKREPLQYITGEAGFWGLSLTVRPGVLIPRPETEVLVELALGALRGTQAPVVIDVGTGSGAIALALKSERPDARVIASDTSEAALQLAGHNAERLGLDVKLVQADLLKEPRLQEAARQAKLIVSNPPYLPESDEAELSPEVRRDPPAALFAGSDGLDVYRRLLQQARHLLGEGSWLLVELDPRNVRLAAELAGEWAEKRVEADLAGRERFLLLRA